MAFELYVPLFHAIEELKKSVQKNSYQTVILHTGKERLLLMLTLMIDFQFQDDGYVFFLIQTFEFFFLLKKM